MPRFLGSVLENLFGKPATVRYPFEKPPLPEGTRGELNFNMVKCDQCQDCERICPSAAIHVHMKEKTIDWEPFKCIYCHICIGVCMHKAIEAKDNVPSPDYNVTKKTFKA